MRCSLGTMASSQAYELMSPSQPVRVPPFALNYLITGDFMFPYAYAHNCDRMQVPHTSFSRECESCAAGNVQSQETAAVHLFGPHVATTTQHMYYHRQRHIFVLLEMRRRTTAERKRPSSTHTHAHTQVPTLPLAQAPSILPRFNCRNFRLIVHKRPSPTTHHN